MLPRVLEPEVMDTPGEARDYDAMDHSAVNGRFVADFLVAHGPCRGGAILDVGTGTARIPIDLCRADPRAKVLGIDLAQTMLDLAQRNVNEAGLKDCISLEVVDAKGLPYPDQQFEAVISNTILHHIPDPTSVLKEMIRVVAVGGTVMVRDLARPETSQAVANLVATYAEGEPLSARALFEASLHAAFRIPEIQTILSDLGLPNQNVTMTSDRHWTWSWKRPSDIER